MTHTPLVRRQWATFAVGALLSLLGCEDASDAGESSPSSSDKAPKSDEQSPNARILPEPLENKLPSVDDDGTEEKRRAVPEPREQARPLAVGRALSDDALKKGPGAGLEMDFQIAWPEAKRSLILGKETLSTWPTLRVQLLREIPARPARMRWVLEGRAFPFPQGTELRSRADRIGHLLLWPDRRSYRIAPLGSLHALFADRRVDRMPFVETEKVEQSDGMRLGKPTKRLSIMTPVGTGIIESIEVTDLPYASELLCTAFLEILRVKSTAELCPRFFVPVHFEIKWPNDEAVAISALSFGSSGTFELDDFRMPPELPIHKRGELPPFDDYFLSQNARQALLPLTKEKAAPLPPPPKDPQTPPPGAEPAAPAAPGPPRNQIVLRNQLSRPLVVVLNKLPYKWLTPGSEEVLYLSSSDIRVSARDFLGEMVFPERALSSPAELHFGDTAEGEHGDDPASP